MCGKLAMNTHGDRAEKVSVKTIGSIFSQEYQKKMRKSHHIHYKPEAISRYYKVFMKSVKLGERHILLRISDEVDLSPALLARNILEWHLSNTRYGGELPPKSLVTQMMREPLMIEDTVLSREVHECAVFDEHYGPIVDNIKRSIGHEYEFNLEYQLDLLGLSYIGENEMRKQGYDKTPDVKFEIPIAVDGYVINWIESKASFGDEHSHKTYLKDQFWSYWNRFGPGMVIYWFGFIDELDNNTEKGIILRDSFPQNIVTLDPKAKTEVSKLFEPSKVT
ncbi:hypothetical protein ScPMuIL_014809 [Solemya velum]